MMKEHDRAIMTSGFYRKPLLLTIFANPVNVFTVSASGSWTCCCVYRRLAEHWISLWIAEDLALELEVSSVATMKKRDRTLTVSELACVAAVSFLFPGEIKQASEKAGERRSMPGWAKNWGEVERPGEREGGGGGEKRNCLQSIPNILPNSVRPRTWSISANWLVISPSIKIWHQKFVFHA